MSAVRNVFVRRAAFGRLVAVGVALWATTPLWADAKTKVTVKAQDLAIREVVADMGRQANVPVRFQPGVSGLVSVRINGSPFTDALTSVLGILGYGWRLDGGTYVIGRFSSGTDDTTATTATVPLKHANAAHLARAFGWLDLSALSQPGSGLDLRLLLPPGLTAPPHPTADGKGLEVRGSATALADFRVLVQAFDKPPATITYRWLVAKATPALVDSLRVYWAQGPMNFGRSGDDRDVLYSAADLDELWKRLVGAPDGLTVLGQGTLAGRDLDVLQVAVQGPGAPRLTVGARLETGLSMRLFAKGTAWPEGTAVDLTVDGGLLPPEEGCIVVSRPKTGGNAALLVIVPTVTVEE